MSDIIQLFTILPVPPEEAYRAWLDSKTHSAFSNSIAKIDPQEGGAFSAWDGYITGSIAILEPEYHIVQRFRTTDFEPDDEDSILDLYFIPEGDGCRFVLTHSRLPEGREDEFEMGWEDHYLSPMTAYFYGKAKKE